MGQPPVEGTALPSPDWVASFIAELNRRCTPAPAQLEQPERHEDPQLSREAERCRREAIEQGRVTPRPAPTDDEIERARAERIAKAAADEETRLELRRAAKRNKPDES